MQGRDELRDLPLEVLGPIDHIGFVVEELDRAVADWEARFGVRCLDRWENPSVGVRTAFFEIGRSPMELVEYTGPVVERFGHVMARHPGVHHLCFRVSDLEGTIERLTGRGLALVEGFPVEGAHGRIAFFHPDPTTGVILEVCQPS